MKWPEAFALVGGLGLMLWFVKSILVAYMDYMKSINETICVEYDPDSGEVSVHREDEDE